MAQRRIKILYKDSPAETVFRISVTPWAIVSILIALVWFVMVVISAVDLLWDYYYPYEGRVLKIETRWRDYISFESRMWEHLIVETPDGRTVDKLVSAETRLPNRIKVGDYVIKGKGFRNTVRPRDKKTTQEILEEWKSMQKGTNEN